MDENDGVRAGSRASHGTGDAVSAVPASIPDASRWLPKEPSPIWGYAKAMKSSLYNLLPEGFEVGYRGGLSVNGTVTTMQEAEALRESIRHLGQMLPSHRKMIAGDIGCEIPEPGWKDALYKMFGTPAQAMSVGTAETQSHD